MQQIMLVQKKLRILVDFIRPFLPLLNSHMVNFLTENYWMLFVQSDIRTEIEKMGYTTFLNLFQNVYTSNNFPSTYEHTIHFLKNINSMRLLDKDICLTLHDFCVKLGMNEYYFPLEGLQKIMSEKKTHEVIIINSRIWSGCSFLFKIFMLKAILYLLPFLCCAIQKNSFIIYYFNSFCIQFVFTGQECLLTG
uniref:Putative product n=1 Tax=Xenopsylla cheopis TaxID=163159 RepID=A0A6M2DYI0_XENCH